MAKTSTSPAASRAVGQRLRQARTSLGLTQGDVAKRIGSNPTYVANIEAGRVNLTVGKLAEIAEALDAPLSIRFAVPAPGSAPRPRKPAKTARGRARRDALLDTVANYILENGIIRFSLRGAAAYSGTTHRILTYYFGSTPELVRAALEHIRARRAETAVGQDLPPDAGPLLVSWVRLREDEDEARVLLEGLAMAAVDRENYGSIAIDSVEQYIPFLELFTPPDWPDEKRQAVATAALATIRGFVLDWLATHDQERIDASIKEMDALWREVGWMVVPPETSGS